MAALNGHNAVVKILLDRGASVEKENLHGERALGFAVTRGHSTAAKLLIETATLDGKDPGLNSALFSATAESRLDFVKLLLDKGASPSYRIHESCNDTLLHFAAGSAQGAIVKLLIDYGSDPQAQNMYNHTPLHHACSEGRSDIVGLLLENGAFVDAQTCSGNTPLHFAIEGDGGNEVVEEASKAVVALLLANGANVNQLDSSGQTALHQSAKKGYSILVKSLLEGGAGLEVKNEQGWTAIQAAAACGQNAVVDISMTAPAQATHQNLEDLIAGSQLRDAAAQGDEMSVQRLLENGAVLAADSAGETALHKAAYHGHAKIIEILLKTKLDINAATLSPLRVQEALNADSSLSGRTALHLAAEMGHTAVMSLLIDSHAHINARNRHGGTPLLSALRLCSTQRDRGLDSIRLLLAHQADLTISYISGGSPLYRAVSIGDENVVHLLLSQGAGIETEKDAGRKVLDAAVNLQHSPILDLLSSCGFKHGN